MNSLISKDGIESTSMYGGVVDWIYKRNDSDSVSCEVLNWGVVKAKERKLSDHDFPWVRLKMTFSSA